MKTFACILEHYQPRADRSLKIVLSTQEASPADVGYLQAHLHSVMAVGIKEGSFEESDLNFLESVEFQSEFAEKSPSKRLRNVMYRMWEFESEGYTDFNLYYISKMETIINHFKSKLP